MLHSTVPFGNGVSDNVSSIENFADRPSDFDDPSVARVRGSPLDRRPAGFCRTPAFQLGVLLRGEPRHYAVYFVSKAVAPSQPAGGEASQWCLLNPKLLLCYFFFFFLAAAFFSTPLCLARSARCARS